MPPLRPSGADPTTSRDIRAPGAGTVAGGSGLLRCLFWWAALATVMARAAPPDITDLIGQFVAADQKPLQLRLRVAVRQPNGRDEVTQIVVKRRRDADLVRVLYQVLWPAKREGDTLYFEWSTRPEPTGFVLKRGGESRPLGAALREPYLDSDLDVEDLVTNFWRWPTHEWTGEGRLGGEDCWILTSRPGRPMANGAAAVRSWISATKLIALKTEFLEPQGGVLKTVVVRKSTRFEGKWAAVITEVTRAGGSTETTIEIVRADRDRQIPLEEFPVAAWPKQPAEPTP